MPERIDKGVTYTAGSQVIAMGLQFGISILLARGLGSQEYGLFGIFQNGILTLSAILDMGVNSAITKFVADADAEQNGREGFRTVSSGIILHLILTVIIWGLMGVMANFAVRTWFDGDYFLYLLFALTIPVLVFINDIIAAVYGLRELKIVAIRLLAQNALLAVLSALFIWRLHFGVRAASLIYSVVLVFMLIWLIRMVMPFIKQNLLIPTAELKIKRIVTFSLPIGSLLILETLIRYSPVLLVKALGIQDPTINQQVASISLAILLGGVAEGILLMVIKSGFGYIGRWQHQGKYSLVLTYIVLMIGAILVIYGGVYLLALLGITKFILFTYGNEYIAINQYIYLTLFLSLTRSVTILCRTVLYSIGRTLQAFYSSLIEFILFVALIAIQLFYNPATNWGVTLLQISALTGSIKMTALIILSFSDLRIRIQGPLYQHFINSTVQISNMYRINRKLK